MLTTNMSLETGGMNETNSREVTSMHIIRTSPSQRPKIRRFNLQASALFPEVTSFREAVIDEMKRLVTKYAGGYEEYERAHI